MLLALLMHFLSDGNHQALLLVPRLMTLSYTRRAEKKLVLTSGICERYLRFPPPSLFASSSIGRILI